MAKPIKYIMYGWVVILAIFGTCFVFAGISVGPVIMDRLEDSIEGAFHKVPIIGNKGYIYKDDAVTEKRQSILEEATDTTPAK